jgi:glucose uptake protein GlcU
MIISILIIVFAISNLVLGLFKRDKIWPKASLFENIATAIAVLGSVLLLVNPVSAGAAVIYSLSMAGVLFGSFAPMVLTLMRYVDEAYKDNKKFKGMSIATWVIGVINIVLTILIGVL